MIIFFKFQICGQFVRACSRSVNCKFRDWFLCGPRIHRHLPVEYLSERNRLMAKEGQKEAVDFTQFYRVVDFCRAFRTHKYSLNRICEQRSQE